MTAVLTDNLPLLAGAPNGIKKLRELILELAVRGKLVPQDAGDEPASELLKRIAVEKSRSVSKGRKKAATGLEADDEELSYRIPPTWAAAPLGEVVEIIRGITFPASEKSKVPAPGRVACLRTANVQKEIEWDDLLFIREDFVSRSEQYVQPNDIVMSMANSRELVGKVALIGRQLEQKTTIGGFLGILRPTLIEPGFVMALLRTPTARSALIDSASQTTNIANVSLAKLRPLPFAIPPLAEQHRIVAKVDELMALCDTLEAQQADAESAHVRLVQALLDSLTQASDAHDFAASLQRLSAHFDTLFNTEASIDALKQAVLQLAVMGKLVPQDPNEESTFELLKRIDTQKIRLLEDRDTRKQKVLSSDELSESPYQVPESWAWRIIDDVLMVTGGVTLGRKLAARELLSKPYLRVANVQRWHLNLTQIKSIEIPADELQKYLLKSGDLLITEGGDWDKVGRTAIWREELPECLHQNHVFRARGISSDWEPRWAEMYLNSAPARDYFAGSSKQTTNLASINMTQLRACPFPLPPIAEQHRIVAKFEEIMSICDQLKSRITDANGIRHELAKALISGALQGRADSMGYREKGGEVIHLASYLVSKMSGSPTFGRVALMKAIYLADQHLDLGLIDGYERQAAGPFDKQLYRAEEEAAQQSWFSCAKKSLKSGNQRAVYMPGKDIAQATAVLIEALGSTRNELDRLIGLLDGKKTDDVEAIATLYAVWNDALAEGRNIDDDALVDEFRNNWHEAKQRFAPRVLKHWLSWIREHQLVPTGKSPHAGMQSSLLVS